MWLSILGLFVAGITAIVSTVTGDGTREKKRSLILLAVTGLSVGLYAAVDSEQEKQKEAAKHALERLELSGNLGAANSALVEIRKAQAEQDPLLRYVTVSVGDLGALNALSGGRKYYVRIAAATTARGRVDLEATKSRIESEFAGATSSGMVAIIPLSSREGSVQLVFGRRLSFAAAEVYLRIAVSHHLANGQAQIFSEP